MNREQLRAIAWMAMNDFTELSGLPDAVSNTKFHGVNAATEDEWPTLQIGHLIIDMLPGCLDDEILVQTVDADTGESSEDLCTGRNKVDLFYLTFSSLRALAKNPPN